MDDIAPEDLRRHQQIEDLIRRSRELRARARTIVEESQRLCAAGQRAREQVRLREMELREQNVICIEQAKAALSKSADAVRNSVTSAQESHAQRKTFSRSGRA